MRIAAIDIGTNSIHMIVVQVRQDLSFEVIDREKDMVRLGAGGLDGRSLTPTAITSALHTLTKFKRLAESHKVDEIIAAATSATREADNGGDFIAEVDRETGIRIKVISGTEEARLIHMAAGYGVDIGSSPAVVVDIGGGSVEVTLGTANHLTLGKSFKTGVIRLTERFVKTDPLDRHDERRLAKFINREMGTYLDQLAGRGFDRLIGTSGTILSLGTMAVADASGEAPDDVRNRRVSAKALRRLRKRLVEADIAERLRVPAMDPRRADLSVAGSVLFDTIVRRLGADEFTLCDLALREGLVLDYIRRNSARIRKVERYPDVRRRSVIELGERCRYWSEHAQQVARIALNIFDQTRSVHGLTDTEREWLEYGSLLHDIGVHISYERHHRHSVLSHQEWRPPRLLAAGDRGDGARRAISPPGDTKEITRGLWGSERIAATNGESVVVDGPSRRGIGPESRTGTHGPGSVSARRRLPRAPQGHWRRGARALGGASTCGAPRGGAREAHSVRGRRQRLQGTSCTC